MKGEFRPVSNLPTFLAELVVPNLFNFEFVKPSVDTDIGASTQLPLKQYLGLVFVRRWHLEATAAPKVDILIPKRIKLRTCHAKFREQNCCREKDAFHEA